MDSHGCNTHAHSPSSYVNKDAGTSASARTNETNLGYLVARELPESRRSVLLTPSRVLPKLVLSSTRDNQGKVSSHSTCAMPRSCLFLVN